MKALSKEEKESMTLKYYNPEIHKASFVLPEFARKVSWFQILSLSHTWECNPHNADGYFLHFTWCLV